MKTSADVVVIGGGIAGLTTALSVAKRGLSVVILNVTNPGAASLASAGMLAPSLGFAGDVLPAALAARDFYPAYLAELEEHTGINIPINRNGILELAETEEHLTECTAAATPAIRLDQRMLQSLEPALAQHPGALLHPYDGAVDNVVLMRALDAATATHPRIARRSVRSTGIKALAASMIVGTENNGQLSACSVLVANGAWATGLRGLSRPLPIRPVRGQLMTIHAKPLDHVVYGAGGYLIPRNGRVLVGATSENAQFDASTSPEGLAELRGIARRMIGGAEPVPMIDHWSGLRPISPDGLPILGTDRDMPGLVYACGYSRNGILFGPWAGDLLATGICSGQWPDDLLPFSVNRFCQ